MNKFLKKIKKVYKRFKYRDRMKTNFYMSILIISAFTLFIGGTYSYFTILDHTSAATIVIANLKYELSSSNENFQNNSITVGAGETLELTLNLKSLNTIHTKYALDYSCDNENVKVYYDGKSDQNVQGEIAGLNSVIDIKIVIENTSIDAQIVNFQLKGGYLQNILESNIIDEYVRGYTITFDPNEGTVDITNKKVTYGEVYGELPVPNRNGYAFIGWFTDPINGEIIKSNIELIKEENHTLYAHWVDKDQAVFKLLSKTNDSEITDYNSGNKGEMYTFSHDATSQTGALTDYRYIGNVPNNYIQFNNETWRIIGVFTVEGENGEKEQRVKIIRDESIGVLSWDMKSDRTYRNEWSTSSLSTMLNGDYVNKGVSFTYTWYKNATGTVTNSIVEGLNATAKLQISPTKWYLGGNSTVQNLGGPQYYSFERRTSVYSGRSTNVVANVGLMYPSDYVYTYANGVDNTCYTDGKHCNNGTPSAGWLFNSAYQWTIAPDASRASLAFQVNSTGYVECSSGVNLSRGIRPCVYLRSDIQIIGGDGSSDNPYLLGN